MASVALTSDKPKRKGLFGKPVAPGEWRKLANWILVWVVIANAGFAMMWFIGAPPRNPEILASGVIGLIVRNQPRWVQFPAFVAAVLYSLLAYVSGMFNLAIMSLLHSLKFFMELNPAHSSEYLYGAAGLVLLMGVGFVCLRRPQGFTDLRLMLLAILAFFSYTRLDWAMSWQMGGHYNHMASAGAPFTSAVNLSGFGPAAAGPKRNLMIVIVESLGQPVRNREMERLVFARYRQSDVTSRFDLTRGTSLYYNSTTSGEVRELCGRWGDYFDYLDKPTDGCLPARLRRAGYETSAYHSFSGKFFERETWWPNVGFQHRTFGDQLLAQGLPECGGVFPGACDREVPRLLADRLKHADKPQFVYWLTLNSHLPVPPGENLDDTHCQDIAPTIAKDYPMICRQFAIWHDLDAALAKEITAPDFPPTDILIVGDHMPPYFDRRLRREFAPDRVPWLLLRWKDDQPAPRQPAVVARSRPAAARG
jgi:hypothetical protein